MKIILSITLLFLFSFSSAWALPECEGSPNKGDDLNKIKHWDNCEGIITSSNGEEYVGEFKDGLPNGQGTYTYANGDKYIGEFKDGIRNGQGTLTLSSGRILEGQWNGKYVGKK